MSKLPYRLGVAGNPIDHSLSPSIHTAFAQAQGDDVDYQRFLFELNQFNEQASAFFHRGGLGLNVTVPFKRHAFKFAQQLDGTAAAAGAVNTLAVENGEVVGYNTDGIGLINDLQQRCGVSVSGASLLILGAGGACQGIIHPLLDAGAERVYIANRTMARAQSLVANLTGEQSTRVEALDISGIENDHPSVGLVINSTALGLEAGGLQALNALPLGLVEGRCCYDLSYGKQAQFTQWAKMNGASRSFDGLGMLVEQAAESYAIWTGSKPHTEAVYERLRRAVA